MVLRGLVYGREGEVGKTKGEERREREKRAETGEEEGREV